MYTMTNIPLLFAPISLSLEKFLHTKSTLSRMRLGSCCHESVKRIDKVSLSFHTAVVKVSELCRKWGKKHVYCDSVSKYGAYKRIDQPFQFLTSLSSFIFKQQSFDYKFVDEHTFNYHYINICYRFFATATMSKCSRCGCKGYFWNPASFIRKLRCETAHNHRDSCYVKEALLNCTCGHHRNYHS